MTFVPKLQVFVLAGHNLIAVALEKTPHLPSTNWRPREPFLFPHYTEVSLFAARLRTRFLDYATERIFLRRVAAEQFVLVSTGASDWLDSSGRVDAARGTPHQRGEGAPGGW